MTGNTQQVLIVTLASGVVSGVVVTLVQELFRVRARASDREEQRRRHETEVRERRRVESARIVGPALAALRDMDPTTNIGALRADNPITQEALRAKWDNWLRASGELEVLGATHPGSDVDRLCQSVIENGTKTMANVQWGVNEGAQEKAWWDATKATYKSSVDDGRSLVRAVLAEPVAN